jgi:hypothetical protein
MQLIAATIKEYDKLMAAKKIKYELTTKGGKTR